MTSCVQSTKPGTKYLLVAADDSQFCVDSSACVASELLVCMGSDSDESSEHRPEEMVVPLPGIPTKRVLHGVVEYLKRVAEGVQEPHSCHDSSDGPLQDYQLDEVAHGKWGDGFFNDVGADNCVHVCELMAGAEYMQIEGLRWLCAAKIACDVQRARTEDAMCGLFGVSLERMDRYYQEMEELCNHMPWIGER